MACKSLAALFCLATITACSQKPTFSLVADEGQIGKGAELMLQSGRGTITMGPIPGWPAGLNEQIQGEPIEPLEKLNGGQFWTATIPSKKVSLKFIVVGNHYICESCVGLQLPIQWTKQQLPL